MIKRIRNFLLSDTPVDDINSIWIDISNNYNFKIRYYENGEWVYLESPISNEFAILMQLYAAETLEAMNTKADLVNGIIPIEQLPSIPVKQDGMKVTGVDGGTLGLISIDDDYMYICTTEGDFETAVWKKTMLSNSTLSQ